ncbi:hypothetical protein QA596_09440 [Balneolales bacterium ANBcel1]|nr:hypothetical protein [Balneolales bacterium ANBcel1]
MQADLIIPPILVGLLVLLILRINVFILETSVESRLHTELQSRSSVALELIQEQVRDLDSFLAEPDTLLQFRTASGDHVAIERAERNLQIIRHPFNPITNSHGAPDTTSHPMSLSDLRFLAQPDTIDFNFAPFLRISLETESRPDQHIDPDAHTPLKRSRVQTDLLLRHRAATNPDQIPL